MRRLIVESPLNELNTTSSIQRLKSFEIVHILRLEPAEFSALVRVNFGNEPARIEDVFPTFHDAKFEHELLEENKGIYTFFIKISPRPRRKRPQELSQLTSGAYISTPFEVKDGKLKVSFLGTAKQIKGILKSLEKSSTKFKIVSLIDAKFSPSSPLQRLTEKQRDVLIKAYKLGYYDRPRKIGSEELARRVNLSKSTWVAHRRKAERRLLTEVLSES
jgi:hypothetical protein